MADTAPKHIYGGLGPVATAVSSTLVAISLILLILRGIYARTANGALRWDFVWVTVGAVLALIGYVLWNIAFTYGMGSDVRVVGIYTLIEGFKFIWIGILIGVFGVYFMKLSIIALYLQVVTPNQKMRRWILHGINISYLIVTLLAFCLVLFSCSPITKLWDILAPGQCNVQPHTKMYTYFYGAYSAITDFALALYPVSIVYNMQAKKSIKIGFCFLMAGGIIPGVAACLRVYYTSRLYSSNNPTYIIVPFILSATMEAWLILILGSVPPLRPVFTRAFGAIGIRLGMTYNDSKAATTPGTNKQSMKGTNASQMKSRGRDDEEKGILDRNIVVNTTYAVAHGDR